MVTTSDLLNLVPSVGQRSSTLGNAAIANLTGTVLNSLI